jgi:hypothetical protein
MRFSRVCSLHTTTETQKRSTERRMTKTNTAVAAAIPLIITSEEAASIMRLKNGRAFSAWARENKLPRIGRNRWSGPAVVKKAEHLAFRHVA